MKWKFAAPIALAAFSALGSNAQAAPPVTITISTPPELQASTVDFWTRGRIAAARPMELPVDTGESSVDIDAAERTGITGPARMKPAREAAPNAESVARQAYARDWAALEEEVAHETAEVPTGTSGVYTYYDVNTNTALWKIYPHRWDGKLTFTTPSGGASCSATSISGNNIVTAAHCVYDTTINQFYSNWAFTPAFRNGNAPYGTFAATACTILTAWVNLTGSFSINTWTRHDVAVCTVGKNSAGQTLNGAVGWAGRLWNAPYTQLNFNSGYPARTYTDALITNGSAQYLRACTNESFQQTTETLGGGCFWGRGISGGSWFVGYKPFVASGWVNSVNSGLFLNQQNLYGARFNNSNIVPLCTARAC